MQQEIEKHIEERKKLDRELELVKRDRDEIKAMQFEET